MLVCFLRACAWFACPTSPTHTQLNQYLQINNYSIIFLFFTLIHFFFICTHTHTPSPAVDCTADVCSMFSRKTSFYFSEIDKTNAPSRNKCLNACFNCKYQLHIFALFLLFFFMMCLFLLYPLSLLFSLYKNIVILTVVVISCHITISMQCRDCSKIKIEWNYNKNTLHFEGIAWGEQEKKSNI